MKYEELFARTGLLLGEEALRAIASKRVILFGVGGVGSWCAEGLIRSGVMHLTMVDPDRVATANCNRQLPATTRTIGELKVEVLKERLSEINPHATIRAIPESYCTGSSASFLLAQYDYIIDAIDTLSSKIDLLTSAAKTGATVFSSMGAALKIDPQQIRVAEFWKVRGCKLAAAIRTKMRRGEKLGKPILCVYSEEKRRNRQADTVVADEQSSFGKAQANGSMVQVTAVFGFTLSGLVIQDIVGQVEKEETGQH